MSEMTDGEAHVPAAAQAAFDAFWASPALGSEPSAPLGREAPGIRHAWDSAAKAAQKPLRDGITELVADITASADATRPSRKTQLEDEFAIALRKLLEDGRPETEGK